MFTEYDLQLFYISIHASTMGGDGTSVAVKQVTKIFQSTPPLWEATLNGSS